MKMIRSEVRDEREKVKIKKILQKNKRLNEWYIKQKWKEKKISLGNENPDKNFYVIRRAPGKIGLFSYVLTNLGHIKYALDHEYIPIIDMQNCSNTYLEDEQIGKENAWEFYFEQPCGYSLNDIKKSKNIILSNGLIDCRIEFPSAQIAYDENKYRVWRYVADHYLNVNNNIVEETEKIYNEIFQEHRVLGVLARGTDYILSQPKKHPVQPNIEELITKCQEVLKKYQCDKLYLTTEDEKIYLEFEKAFKNKLVSMSVKRYQTFNGENINDVINKEDKKRYIRGKEYLISILLLAKCHCLVGGNTGGSQGALLLSDKYEYKYIFNLGIY